MALEKAGVQLTADGAQRYVADVDKASKATRKFGEEAQTAAKQAAKLRAATAPRDAMGRFLKTGSETATTLKRVEDAADGAAAGIDGVGDAGNRSGPSLRSMASSLKGAAAGFFFVREAAESALQAAQGFYNAAAEGARSLDVGRAFRLQVREGGGDPAQFLARLKEASAGTIDEFTLIRTASQAMTMQVTSDVEELATLLEFARSRAQRLGISATEAYDRLVRGIGKAEVEILDELGLTFRLEDVWRQYADTLGKTTRELTEAERKQATLNRVLAEATTELEKTGGVVPGMADSYGTLASNAADAATAFKEFLAIKFQPVAGDMAEAIYDIAEALKRVRDEAAATAETDRAVRGLISRLILQGDEDTARRVKFQLEKFGADATAKWIKDFLGEIEGRGDVVAQFTAELAKARFSIEDLEDPTDETARRLRVLNYEFTEATKGARGLGSVVSGLGAFFRNLSPDRNTPSISEFIDQARQAQEARGRDLQGAIDPARSAVTAAKERARATQEQIREVQRDGARQLAELAQESGRRLAEIDRSTAQQRIDLARDFAQERVDLARDMVRDEARALQDFARESARIEQDRAREAIRIARDRARDAIREARDEARDEARSQRDRARTEQRALQDHLERLRQIDMQYAQSRREAIRNRDGKALSDAIRTHRTQRSEAERDFDIASRRRQEDYEEQRRDRREAIEIARRDREEQYRQEDADRAEAYREEDRDREAAFRQEQQDRAEAYRVRLADMQAQFQREQARITEAAQRQRDEWLRSYAQQRADIVSANRERLAALQVQLNSEVAAVYRAVQQMMEVYKAYYEWLVAMQRWAAAAGATPTTSTTPPAASSSSSTVPAGSGGGGGSSQSSVSAIRPTTSPFMSTATVSPPARPTAGGGGGNVMNVVVNAPGATAATVDAIRQAVRQEMVPVVNRMAQAFT